MGGATLLKLQQALVHQPRTLLYDLRDREVRECAVIPALLYVRRESGADRVPIPIKNIEVFYDRLNKITTIGITDDALHLLVTTANEPEVRTAPTLDGVMRTWGKV